MSLEGVVWRMPSMNTAGSTSVGADRTSPSKIVLRALRVAAYLLCVFCVSSGGSAIFTAVLSPDEVFGAGPLRGWWFEGEKRFNTMLTGIGLLIGGREAILFARTAIDRLREPWDVVISVIALGQALTVLFSFGSRGVLPSKDAVVLGVILLAGAIGLLAVTRRKVVGSHTVV